MSDFATVAKVFEFDFNHELNEIFTSKNIQNWIIKTEQNRLYKSGQTGDLIILKTDNSAPGMPYSFATMDVKSFYGQRISNVTLKDKGEFYSSFRIALNLFGFEINADFEKEDGHIQKKFTNQFSSKAKFEESVLSLTDEELKTMIETMIIPKIYERFEENIVL